MNKDLFKDMPNNPFVDERRPLVDVYPHLRRCEAFNECPDLAGSGREYQVMHLSEPELDMCVRFIVLYVEPSNNPLAKERDLAYRASVAWDLVGAKKSSPLRQLQADNHWWFNLITFEYFKYTYDLDYQQWFSLKSQFHAITKMLTSRLDEDIDEKQMGVRQKAAAVLKSLKEEISTLESFLFKDNFLKSQVSIESFFPDRMAERFALDYRTKVPRKIVIS